MNKKSLLVLAASGLLTIGMASCGQQPGQSTSAPSSIPSVEPSSEPSSASKTVSKISKTTLPKFAVGEEIDLDQYITIQYTDKSEDHEYTITNTDEDLAVSGHKLIATAVKSYSVTVKAGSKTSRVTLDVRSEANIELAKFFAPLAENPLNYRIDAYSFTQAGSLVYNGEFGSFVHNEKYAAGFDATNKGAVDEKGEPDSWCVATLADKYSYVGYYNTSDELVFKAGKVGYDEWYLTQELSFSGYDFTSTFEEDEETGEITERLLAPASVNGDFCSYGLSYPLDRAGYTFDELEYLGMLDTDGDNEADMVLVVPYFHDSENEWFLGVFGISQIGSCKEQDFEEAIVDPTKVPEAITADELIEGFEKVSSATSYTLSYRLYASDEEGAPLGDDEISSSAFNYMFGTGSMSSMLTYDNQGIQAYRVEGEDVTGEIDYFNYNGAGYYVDFSGKTAETKAAGVEDIMSVDAVKAWLLSITSADVNNTNWTSKQSESGTTSLGGKVGDNNGIDRGNMLFEAVFNPFRWVSWTGGQYVGTILTEAVEFDGGDKHALTLYSNWESVSVDDDGIVAIALVYLPIGYEYSYCTFIMEVSEIGTTVNDFSAYYPATAEAGE